MESDCYIEGLATTFDKPYPLYDLDGVQYYECISSRALDDADMSDVILQYDHQGKVLARMSNQTLIVEPTEDGLFVAADLSRSAAAKDLYEEIENGLVSKMSWAFTVGDEEYDRKTRIRTIRKIKKVYDVSAVSLPANESTDISARNFAEGRAEAERFEQLERRKRALLLKIKIGGTELWRD